MTIQLFGVDADSVQRHCFPHHSPFSDDTGPSVVTVEEVITEKAGFLAGKLLTQNVDANSIEVLSPAYAQCAGILRLMVALDIVQAMTGQDPAVAQAWQKRVDDWCKALDEKGAYALGDSSLTTENPNGPLTHLSYLGLSEPSAEDASTIEPFFRRDDTL